MGNLRGGIGGQRIRPEVVKETHEKKSELSMTVDWTAEGVVPPVVDGGDLPNGYNYMVGYSVDSAHAIQRGAMTLYAVDELFDCSTDMQSAMEFVVSKGLETLEDYKDSSGWVLTSFRKGCLYDPTKPSLHVKEWDTFLKPADGSIVEEMTS